MKPYEPIQNGAFLHVLRKDVFFVQAQERSVMVSCSHASFVGR